MGRRWSQQPLIASPDIRRVSLIFGGTNVALLYFCRRETAARGTDRGCPQEEPKVIEASVMDDYVMSNAAYYRQGKRLNETPAYQAPTDEIRKIHFQSPSATRNLQRA
jgi:hypothetical protein